MPSPSPTKLDPLASQRKKYWRGNLWIVSILLLVWFFAGYVVSILMIEWFNRFRIGELELGFWFAQQGSILVFVILVAVYAWLMDRLDRKFQKSSQRGSRN